MKNLTIIVEDRPGTFADICEALGEAKINIEGHCGYPCEDQSIAHLLVKDANAARRVLEKTGIKVVKEQEVLVIDLENRPGELGKIVRKIAKVGVNLGVTYLATNTRIILEADNLEKARRALE
jgi:hypothetical protein